jgi:hypothetical protein
MQSLLPICSDSFPKTLESAVRSYERCLADIPKAKRPVTTIWQTWREPLISPAVEVKWDRYLQSHSSWLERRVVTDLYDVFPKLYGDDTYYNRTVDRLLPGAARADVWRYATLYYYGGIYIDADSTLVDKPHQESVLERWFNSTNNDQKHGPSIPILSNEGHQWRRQYVARCQGIWNAANMTLPDSYERSVLQWMLIFPLPRHPILWQALQLVDQLMAAASRWDHAIIGSGKNDGPRQQQQQQRHGDKVLCVTGPAVLTVAVHSVLETFPQLTVHWEGIDYNGQARFKDKDAAPDELHYQKSKLSSSARIIRDTTTTSTTTQRVRRKA